MTSSVIFVCLGNICRSPAGESILRKRSADRRCSVRVASAGIAGYHVGEQPDERALATLRKRGYDASKQRAQKFHKQMFDEYDLVLAADLSVRQSLLSMCRSENDRNKVLLMTHFSEKYSDQEVPDPYYGTERDFFLVVDMLEDACDGLLRDGLLPPC